MDDGQHLCTVMFIFIYTTSNCHESVDEALEFSKKHDSSQSKRGFKLANFKPDMELFKQEMEFFGHSRVVALSLYMILGFGIW